MQKLVDPVLSNRDAVTSGLLCCQLMPWLSVVTAPSSKMLAISYSAGMICVGLQPGLVNWGRGLPGAEGVMKMIKLRV